MNWSRIGIRMEDCSRIGIRLADLSRIGIGLADRLWIGELVMDLHICPGLASHSWTGNGLKDW